MILANVADGIAAAVIAIPGLRVVPYVADRVEPPALVVGYPDQSYDIDFGEDDTWILPVYVFLSRASDRSTRESVSAYISRSGAYSIKTAVESDRTLGGACDTVAVKRARPGTAMVAGIELLSIEFTLEVIG